MAASKPTSWLSVSFHIVFHLAVIGDLSCGSGLFPFSRRTLAPAVCLPHSLRSEEHTSELQSLMRNSYAVFCLKKKTNQIITVIITIQYIKITVSTSVVTLTTAFKSR